MKTHKEKMKMEKKKVTKTRYWPSDNTNELPTHIDKSIYVVSYAVF